LLPHCIFNATPMLSHAFLLAQLLLGAALQRNDCVCFRAMEGVAGPAMLFLPQTDPLSSAPAAIFLAGWRAAWTSVFVLVLTGTFVGVGALAHEYGFSLVWVLLSTVLIWAAPAQVILISALGAGATPVEAAIAVGLSGVRLLPMVVSLLALIKMPATKPRALVLPAHLTAVSMWVEALRLVPALPRAQRIGFCMASPSWSRRSAGRRRVSIWRPRCRCSSTPPCCS
jgi:hypothetical protein